MAIEHLVPGPLRNPYRRLRSYVKNRQLGHRNAEIFGNIYANRLWNDGEEGEVYSGSGSYDPAVPAYVALVRDLVAQNKVRSIIEIGCGDFSVGEQYAFDVPRYLGVDVSRSVITRNTEQFARDGVSFDCADASLKPFEPYDLCLIRQVLQHLSNRDIEAVLRRVQSHALVLVTEHLPASSKLRKPNLDKRSGADTRLTFFSGVYVDQPPFSRQGEIVLESLVANNGLQASPGEILRSTLLRNREL